MSKYNVIESSDNYSKTCGSLCQYYRDEPALNNDIFHDSFAGNSASFKFKPNITGSAGNDGTENVKIMVPLKY